MSKSLRRAMETKEAYRLTDKVPLICDETELITPEIAKKYLSLDGQNRPVDWKRVDEYSKKMAAGEWKLIPQPIVFDEKGRLLTGQQRLHAVCLAQTPVYFRVSRGCPRENREDLDRGKPLSAADIAVMRTGRAEKPFKIVEKQIARGLCFLLGEKPNLENIAQVLTANEKMTSFIAEEMERIGKTKAILMVLCAICYLSKDKGEVFKLLQKTNIFSERLRQKMLPTDIEECWGRGLIFKSALQNAVEIVKCEIN